MSSSIANRLLGQSPWHAMTAHPRLSAEPITEESEAFDVGTAAHAYLLEGQRAFVIIEADDYRTKLARELRDAARADGKVPLLAKRWQAVQDMARMASDQLDRFSPRPFQGGAAEQTLVWKEGDIWCRARLDYLHDGHRWVDDYKSTGGSAEPDAWSRGPLFGNGYDLQAAFYLRGVSVLFGVEATFRFVIQETYPPYALSVVAPGPDILALAEKKRHRAVELWRTFLETGRWPGYPTEVCTAGLPPWIEARYLEREMREDDGRPVGDQLSGWGR